MTSIHGIFSKIDRLEVIEDSKRKYVKWNCKIEKSIQDDGKTLKIFVTNSQRKKDKDDGSNECLSGETKHKDEQIIVSVDNHADTKNIIEKLKKIGLWRKR
jgi:hypothetical protein